MIVNSIQRSLKDVTTRPTLFSKKTKQNTTDKYNEVQLSSTDLSWYYLQTVHLYHLHLNNIRPLPRINSFPPKFIQRHPKTREHSDILHLPVLRQLRTNTVSLEKDTGNRDAVAKLLWSRQDATNKTRNRDICKHTLSAKAYVSRSLYLMFSTLQVGGPGYLNL